MFTNILEVGDVHEYPVRGDAHEYPVCRIFVNIPPSQDIREHHPLTGYS
jgi:hypothetical protein